jgi:hypothetical protein
VDALIAAIPAKM